MTGPVVVVTRDIPLGRTCVSYYLDEEDPKADLSWFATHRVESGVLVPIPPERAA